MIEFNAGKWFTSVAWEVGNIEELSALLSALERMERELVIRGQPVPEFFTPWETRRLKKNFQTPSEGLPWVMIDFDKIKLPRGLRCKLDDRRVREHVIGLLPAEFHDASYHWQLSSTAGLYKTGVASLHAWFWLARPIPDADLKRWAKSVNERAGYKLVDPAVFADVQPHYTAAPVFEGVENPYPIRSGLERKKLDAVAIELPPLPRAKRRSGGRAMTAESSVGFEGWLARIGDHAGGEGFHEPIIRAAASYVATYGRDGTDVDALYERIRAVVLAADGSAHAGGYVEHMASREHIVPAIEGALGKFGDQPSARRKSRSLEGVEPHFPGECAEASEASAALEASLRDFFSDKKCLRRM
ncbi:hypothetical protein [Zeimonas arvi]|uniref:RepB-like DNA primase domain-containing protein n=1 Tax=Zeimonas arvi TaxID=2498847 RepID=A0A5C8NPA7_9BURK|nr:hypothetical protein [Zeimonas arvi]TXL62661.1 hypothetical protein FHP08_17715 [Zeimonas arvi]